MKGEIHPENYRAPEMWHAKRSGRTKPRKKRCNKLKKLSETLLPCVYDDFTGMAKAVLTPEHKEGLRKLLIL